ncbi:MAG: DUF3302 domain-containing protein [Gammaproteobacteria bacterium]
MFLDIFALIVMGVLIAVVIWLVVLLGPLPGKIAAERGHPQADAVRVLGWVGLVTMGGAWLAALVWAYYKPKPASGATDPDLERRVAELEQKLEQSTQGGQES